jgi:hypothetical protein
MLLVSTRPGTLRVWDVRSHRERMNLAKTGIEQCKGLSFGGDAKDEASRICAGNQITLGCNGQRDDMSLIGINQQRSVCPGAGPAPQKAEAANEDQERRQAAVIDPEVPVIDWGDEPTTKMADARQRPAVHGGSRAIHCALCTRARP